MAEIEPEIIDKVKKFLELVRGKGIDIKKSYIFGSYANNTFNEWSDIDLAIVSDSFEGNMLIDIKKILGLSLNIDYRISVLPLNSESLDSYFVQSEVLKKGYPIS